MHFITMVGSYCCITMNGRELGYHCSVLASLHYIEPYMYVPNFLSPPFFPGMCFYGDFMRMPGYRS